MHKFSLYTGLIIIGNRITQKWIIVKCFNHNKYLACNVSAW